MVINGGRRFYSVSQRLNSGDQTAHVVDAWSRSAKVQVQQQELSPRSSPITLQASDIELNKQTQPSRVRRESSGCNPSLASSPRILNLAAILKDDEVEWSFRQ